MFKYGLDSSNVSKIVTAKLANIAITIKISKDLLTTSSLLPI